MVRETLGVMRRGHPHKMLVRSRHRVCRLLACFALFATATLGVGGTAIHAATLLANYDLASGSYANALSGSAALGALSPLATSGSFGFVTSGTNPGWFWSGAAAPGTGLSLSGLPANDGMTFGDYSIGIRFAFGQVAGYRKLIDFKDGNAGQYVHDGTFRFYDNGFNTITGGTIASDATADFVLTRAAGTGVVTAYLNGSSTAIFSFVDGVDARTDASRTLTFFRDNGLVGTEFSNSGAISLLRIWNGPLTAEQIPTAMTAWVPEPAGLAVAGFAAVFWWLGRRRSAAR